MISKQEILHANILIVDDQQTNLLLLEHMLLDAGYNRVSTTTNPYTVCAFHRRHLYDLILLDLQMPGMDGFQVMKCLKTIETDDYMPVLAITAQPDHKQRALTEGAKDFVSKPFDIVEIQTRIHNLLEVRLLHKKLKNANAVLEQTVATRTAELRASEARFRRLTELSADWYWEQDEHGNFTSMVGPVLEMLGIGVDDVAEDSPTNQSVPAGLPSRKTLQAHLASRQPFLDFVYSGLDINALRRYLMVSGEPIFDSSGRYIGYRGVGKDVTETICPEHIFSPPGRHPQ